MDGPDIPREPIAPASARELLEKYLYGQDDVNVILRFAEEHRLSKDSMVWLLTSILKINTNLVVELLSAIKGVDEAISRSEAWSRKQAGGMEELGQRLRTQISQAANNGAATLDLKLAKVSALMREFEKFTDNLSAAARDFASASEAFKKLINAKDTESALKALTDAITRNAKQEVRKFALEMMDQLSLYRHRKPTGLYIISLLNLAGVAAIIAKAVF